MAGGIRRPADAPAARIRAGSPGPSGERPGLGRGRGRDPRGRGRGDLLRPVAPGGPDEYGREHGCVHLRGSVNVWPGSRHAGWVRYTDPSGFSIKVPPGWSVTATGTDEVRFTGPMPGYVILVAWNNDPKADAYADWQQQAAAKAASDSPYQQIGIQRVYYRGWNAADWEFINSYDGEETHVLDRGFVVIPGTLGYAIEIYGPVNGFGAARTALWNGVTATFQPASRPAGPPGTSYVERAAGTGNHGQDQIPHGCPLRFLT